MVDEDPPPRVQPLLKAAPKIREIYWCTMPKDAQLPEFWKTRPVVVITHRRDLYGAVTVIPCTTLAQPTNPWAFRLRTMVTREPSWAICDKVTTVAVSRLSAPKQRGLRLPDHEFRELLEVLFRWLPPSPVKPGVG
jgi:mRNA interferase MazF